VATDVRRCEATGKLCMGRVAAKATAKRMRRRLKEPISHYHCKPCDWWHVGTTPARKRRRRR
jgi:hypothetical protein